MVNTRYFKDILKRYIHIVYIYIHCQTGKLQVYYRYVKWYIRGVLDGILKVYQRYFQSQSNGILEVDSWYIKWYTKRISKHIVMVYQMEY